MIESDQCEGAEAPEDEGVRESGKRTLADDLRLGCNFNQELPDARSDRIQIEIGSGARAFYDIEDALKTTPEQRGRCGEEEKKNAAFQPRWICHMRFEFSMDHRWD